MYGRNVVCSEKKKFCGEVGFLMFRMVFYFYKNGCEIFGLRVWGGI